jgi:uncharacterized damage-inducible protein DinB
MTLIDQFIAELEREAPRTRRVLAEVPQGKDDWKPHPKSMPLGRLAGLVASMPSWFSLIIDQDELDVAPPAGSGQYKPPAMDQLVAVHDQLLAKAYESLHKRDDNYILTTKWKLLAGGHVAAEDPRHVVIRDTINHWAHHRGQLTVYLRLLDAKVPSIYGPSADDQRFL